MRVLEKPRAEAYSVLQVIMRFKPERLYSAHIRAFEVCERYAGMSDLILLHGNDNVLVCRQRIEAGRTVVIDGTEVLTSDLIEVGHKVARFDLAAGDKVIKYGAPIGSMTEAAARGRHVHMHNMKSDYIPSHTRKVVG